MASGRASRFGGLAHLVGAIGTINLWNRLSIALRTTPASARTA
jgi:hypothetical protein